MNLVVKTTTQYAFLQRRRVAARRRLGSATPTLCVIGRDRGASMMPLGLACAA